MKLFYLFVLLAFVSGVAKGSVQDPPSGLMIEFIREPEQIRLLDPKPEFSWIVPQKASSQTAYQISVATTREKLEKDIPDIWNSDKTVSKKSTEVEYAGRKLEDNSTYYWKVRIWDNKDKDSKWSEIQLFKTGVTNGYATTGNRLSENIIKPVKIVRKSDECYFADFGKDAFGTLELEISPLIKDTIIVHLGEKTSETNKIDRNPGGTIRYTKVLLPVEPGKTRYVINLPRDERNTGAAAVHLPDSIGVITPFRYCELEYCKVELKPENLVQKAYWYYTNDKLSSFICSDTVLNQVWNICKYSIKATSFAGIYVDGDRERIPYEADAYIDQLGHYYTDREYSIARLTNEYFIRHPTWPTEWILQTVPLFFYDMMYTGNFESVNFYYEELKHKTLTSLARPDGLISVKNVTDEIMKNLGFSNPKDRIRDIVDWPPSQKDTGWKLATSEGERDGYDMAEVNTVVNAFYYNGLLQMASIADYLGKSVDAVLYRNQAAKVYKAINEKLFDKSKRIYVDGEFSDHSSLHANMMALAFDIVPPEYKNSVAEFVKSRGMACSVYGAQYLLEGLYKAGASDYALSLMTSTSDRSWWNMIRSGSTMTMEAWDMKYKPNSDLNHAWGAVPANIIGCYMWGIAPVQPGYSKAIIKPQLSDLKFSKISVPTIRGNINAEYTSSGKSKEYIITIPANMDCDFVLTGVNNLTIVFNNRKFKTQTGIFRLKPGINKISLLSD